MKHSLPLWMSTCRLESDTSGGVKTKLSHLVNPTRKAETVIKLFNKYISYYSKTDSNLRREKKHFSEGVWNYWISIKLLKMSAFFISCYGRYGRKKIFFSNIIHFMMDYVSFVS